MVMLASVVKASLEAPPPAFLHRHRRLVAAASSVCQTGAAPALAGCALPLRELGIIT